MSDGRRERTRVVDKPVAEGERGEAFPDQPMGRRPRVKAVGKRERVRIGAP